METFNLNICVVIPLIISLFIRYSSSSDVEGEKSRSTVLVIAQGHTTTVNCASLFVDHHGTNNSNIIYVYKWTVPKNVFLRESWSAVGYSQATIPSNIKILLPHQEIGGTPTTTAKPWVESKKNGDLVFHSPTKSLDGHYSCTSISPTGEIVRVYALLIRVVKQSHFDTEYRAMIAFISAAVVLVTIVAVFFGCRHYKRKKTQQYAKAQTEEIMKVPTITVLDVYGVKVEEDIL